MKHLFSLFAFAFLILFTACKDDTISEGDGTKKITYITPKSVVVGSDLSIFGANFGFRSEKSGIVLSNGIYISSTDTVNCKKWNQSTVIVKIPAEARNGAFKLIVNGDTLNGFDIEILHVYPITMLDIAPATFWMGSNQYHQYEKPIHQVILTQAYQISAYEITQKQWLSVMGNNPSEFINEDFPVENISWLDAVKFCNKLSKSENLDTCYKIINDTIAVWENKFAKGYRLPTEAEWEYAAKADTSYSAIEPDYNTLLQSAVFCDNSGYKSRRVGSMKANKFGLYDMIGNVWEYCWDYYSIDYYTSQMATNPYGPQSGDTRVIRGASFRDGATFCRNSARVLPINTKFSIGFRVVKNKN